MERTERQVARWRSRQYDSIRTALEVFSMRVTGIEETLQRDWQTQVQQRDRVQQIETQMMQPQEAMCGWDALNIQAGEQNRISQSKHETVQWQVEVIQRLHTLEKAGEQQMERQWTETKGQDNTTPALHNKREVKTSATKIVDTDTVSVSAGAQHKRDEVDATEKVTDGMISPTTEDDYARVHRATAAHTETEVTGAHSKDSEAREMDAAAATSFINEGLRNPTEDVQPHQAGISTACTLDYNLSGIMKQMLERTPAHAARAHDQSKKV